jgi:hypothetical protein
MSADPCTLLLTVDDLDGCSVNQYDEVDPPTDEDIADVIAGASRVAWALGGRQHGICSVENERPGRVRHGYGCSRPGRVNGTWTNSCVCAAASTVTLGHTPVVSIEDVRIGGASLVQGVDYELVRPNRLVRRDGGVWPADQLLHLDDGDLDVLVVDYTYGAELDPYGQLAVAALACEMLKAKKGKACKLPERVTSVTRQGVSYVLLDPMSFLKEGRTGVYLFDSWITNVNPGGLTGPPLVRSPDVAIPRGGMRVVPT